MDLIIFLALKGRNIIFNVQEFQILFLPLDGGGQVGVKEKVNHPPLAPPTHQGRGIFSSRRPNLMFRNFKLVAADFSLRSCLCRMLSPSTVPRRLKACGYLNVVAEGNLI